MEYSKFLEEIAKEEFKQNLQLQEFELRKQELEQRKAEAAQKARNEKERNKILKDKPSGSGSK